MPLELQPKGIKMKRVVFYVRCSTSDQTVEMQLHALHAVADQRGWEVVETYADAGISGSKDDRPALNRMMTDAAVGKFNLVACWKLDRLGRSLRHLVNVIHDLGEVGVGFVSLKDAGIDTTTSQGRLMLGIIGSFAAYERDIIRSRVLQGQRAAKDRGVHIGRPVKQMDVRPAVALLEQGRNLQKIANILGVSRTTLRRRLQEQGKWPFKAVSKSLASKAN
jgi:DNA invertase Pin-like site-specific DNA recombinase